MTCGNNTCGQSKQAECASIVREALKAIPDLLAKIEADLSDSKLWDAAIAIGAYYNANAVSGDVRALCRKQIDAIRETMGVVASQSQETTTVVFGTSGWRGVIGADFTLRNVHKVVRGIIEMMQTPAFLSANNYLSFDEVKSHGIVVFRDNRFMGDLFMDAAMKELAAAEIKIHFAGECPTGVGSALVTELNAAGSINFTPSHNPMQYAGLKFNPADGGPADPSLTTIIEEKSNAYMNGAVAQSFAPATTSYDSLKTDLDAAGIFTKFIEEKGKVFDLKKIRQWLLEKKSELCLVVDFMHGASRGYVQRVLGDDVVDGLGNAIVFLNEDEDFSFHGVKPEPSAKNQAPLIDLLKKSGKKITLAVALDPDADRIRFADANLDIDMNRFGAIAYASLLQHGFDGGIASTAPSSDFALEIAKREKKKVYEMAVGFKNFRQPLSSGDVLVAFEESDGISFLGHTLEKCALAGFLMALESMRLSGKNLSEQYTSLQEKYGYFYPDKDGAELKGISVEEWQTYKKQVVDILQHKLYKAGDTVEVGGVTKTITEVNTADGAKLIFEDKSWILLRPSGTEPKFRYYFEVASTSPLADITSHLKAYAEAGAAILQKARDQVK